MVPEKGLGEREAECLEKQETFQTNIRKARRQNKMARAKKH
jgi:hypothetical protein